MYHQKNIQSNLGNQNNIPNFQNISNVPNILNNQNNQSNQNNQNISGNKNNQESQEFLKFLNTNNNMNLKKIILFYSKFSKVCEQFVNAFHPNYKLVFNFICVDNSEIRKRLSKSKYKLDVVPAIFMLFENGKINVHFGNELHQLVMFFNKNMESFIVFKTNEGMSLRKNNMIGELEQQPETPNQKSTTNITRLNIKPPTTILKPKKMSHLPRVKQTIPQDFNKTLDVGISTKRIVPKGKKEHLKMAHSSIKVFENQSNLDTIEEENDEQEDEDNNEEETNFQIEDAEILDDNIDDIITTEDTTIDKIIKKDGKSLKDIASDMQQDRELMDEKSKPKLH
jgi:hypothetical protein